MRTRKSLKCVRTILSLSVYVHTILVSILSGVAKEATMKEVYSVQEIGTLIDQGIQASFTRHHIVAHVTVNQLPDSDRIQAVMLLSLGQYNITLVEMEYEDISELLERFDIEDGEEIWEVSS